MYNFEYNLVIIDFAGDDINHSGSQGKGDNYGF